MATSFGRLPKTSARIRVPDSHCSRLFIFVASGIAAELLALTWYSSPCRYSSSHSQPKQARARHMPQGVRIQTWSLEEQPIMQTGQRTRTEEDCTDACTLNPFSHQLNQDTCICPTLILADDFTFLTAVAAAVTTIPACSGSLAFPLAVCSNSWVFQLGCHPKRRHRKKDTYRVCFGSAVLCRTEPTPQIPQATAAHEVQDQPNS